jgi:hypothetical protein
VSDAETYLRELRRALPMGCRRRLVAEMREHFASAIAAEAEHCVETLEAERLTIERLGPAAALAEQLRSDLRSGALGRRGRLVAALTMPRLVAVGTVLTTAIVLGAVFVGKRSPQAPPAPRRTADATVTLDPSTGEVRPVLLTLQATVEKTYWRYTSATSGVKPIVIELTPVPHRYRVRSR